jgi:3D (Asp-Asp-Asp) domain-containing protein
MQLKRKNLIELIVTPVTTVIVWTLIVSGIVIELSEVTTQLNTQKSFNTALIEEIEVLEQKLSLEKNTSEFLIEDRNELLQVIKNSRTVGQILQVRTTAYAPFDNVSGMCNDGDPTHTSTGTYPDWGTIAVDPKIIPYGTKLYIPGYGLAIAEDTGGALRNKSDVRIDLYVDTYAQAKEWGVRLLDVIILEWGE